jgi:xylose isomerase
MYEQKISVILPNYNTPGDRFSSYGGKNYSMLEQIDVCGKQGAVTGIEMLANSGDRGVNDKNVKEVKKALQTNGLKLVSLMPISWKEEFINGSLGNPDKKLRRKAIDFLKNSIDLAAELDCPYVSQWPGQDGWDYYFDMNYLDLYQWWVEGMQELADYNPKMKLGLEAKPTEPRMYSFIDHTTKTLLLLNDIDRKNVGVCLDIGHSLFGHQNLGEAVALSQMKGNKLFHMHMNDNYGDMDGDMFIGSVHFMAFVEMYFWLHKTGYNNWTSVDIFPFRTDPSDTILELDELVAKGNAVETTRFFRETLLGK